MFLLTAWFALPMFAARGWILAFAVLASAILGTMNPRPVDSLAIVPATLAAMSGTALLRLRTGRRSPQLKRPQARASRPLHHAVPDAS